MRAHYGIIVSVLMHGYAYVYLSACQSGKFDMGITKPGLETFVVCFSQLSNFRPQIGPTFTLEVRSWKYEYFMGGLYEPMQLRCVGPHSARRTFC